ncbi:MAG: 3-deoxy-D-manno-octulosonic acid transferase, partial [Burkholderiaceae bacterium]|nr:3-deoxy-D-manno-octulosonic acid transferase [Burkholderiaceae bacterium]
ACVAAQSQADAERIARLYAGGITVTGNLKFDLTPDPALVAQGVAARAALGARPVWLLASTREGEEGLLLDAFRRERAARGATATPDAEPARQAGSEPGFSGGPLLVVVPRHPQRFDEVARLIEAHGFSCARRSQGALLRPASPVTVILGDSIGELALYYAAADVAFIGGSLLPYGGQNLIEACAVGCPVVLGPSTFNFAQAAADAIAAGAAVQVSDADQVMRALRAIATDAGRREAMRQAALAFASAHRGATARTLALITAVLAEGAADAAAQPAAPPADRA